MHSLVEREGNHVKPAELTDSWEMIFILRKARKCGKAETCATDVASCIPSPHELVRGPETTPKPYDNDMNENLCALSTARLLKLQKSCSSRDGAPMCSGITYEKSSRYPSLTTRNFELAGHRLTDLFAMLEESPVYSEA